jgi:phage tail-like protein
MASYAAQNVTPGQARHFRVELEGVNPFQVQKCGIPKVEQGVIEVSDGQTMIPYPGMSKTGEITLEEFIDAFHKDDETLKWFFGNGNPETGIAAGPYDIRDGSIVRVDGAGNEIQRWRIQHCFPSAIEGYDFDKTADKAVIRKITLHCKSCVPVF